MSEPGKPWYMKDRWFVSYLNFDKDVRSKFAFPDGNRVYICDCTIRKINYATGFRASLDDKLGLARMMHEVGVDQMYINYPMEQPTYNTIKAVKRRIPGLKITGVIFGERPIEGQKKEIDRGIEAGADTLELNVSAVGDVNLDKEMAKMIEAEKYLSDKKAKFSVGFVDATLAEVATLTDFVNTSLEYGPIKIWLADSTSAASPEAMKHLVGQVLKAMRRKVPIGVHCHDVFGMGAANTVAAVTAGASMVDVTMTGLADHCGLARLEVVAMTLEALYGINTGLKLEKLHDYGELMAKITGIRQPPYQTIVGENAFSYELPTHLNALLRGRREIPLNAAVVGEGMRLFWGTNTMADPNLCIGAKLNQMNLEHTPRDVERIADLIRDRINRIEKYPYWLPESEVEQICRRVIGGKTL